MPWEREREGRREGAKTVPRTLLSHLRTAPLDKQQTLAVLHTVEPAVQCEWSGDPWVRPVHNWSPAQSSVTHTVWHVWVQSSRGPWRGSSWANSFASYVGKRDKSQAGLPCQSLSSAAVLCMALGFLPGVSGGLCSTWTLSGRATVWISALEPWPWKMVQIMFNGCWSNIWLARIFVPDGLAKFSGLQTLIAVASGPEHTVVTL